MNNSHQEVPHLRNNPYKVAIASMVGTAIEFYDYYIYAAAAVLVFNTQFFDKSDEHVAVLLSLCSEADAFVAASLPEVSPTAQLVFLVVGPMVDVKLFAMQSGAFGARFATRFMPLTLFVCIWSAAVVGAVMFGTF